MGGTRQFQVTQALLTGLAHSLSCDMRRDLYDDAGNLVGTDDEIAERMAAAIRRVDSIAAKIQSALQAER